MSEVTGKEPCPSCRERGQDRSGDNLIRYADGGSYCFACGGAGERIEGSSATPTQTTTPKKSSMINNLEYGALIKRGITEETCRHFNYAMGVTSRGTKVQVATYTKGNATAQKTRDAKKNFMFLGEPKLVGLWGQHLWKDGGKKVCITEGEIDAMSLSQLQNNKWPVVSVPNGAAGAAAIIAQEIEWLNKFDKVVFMFDMDEAGQKAAKECGAVLPPGKAYIARLPMKDANLCLTNGKGKELLSSMWDAAAYRPDGVVDISSVVDEACEPVEQGLDWPWPSLTKKTYGRRRAELYGFGGGTGTGKSTAFKQVAKHVLENDDLPVGLIFLEEQPKLTAKTMAGMMMGKRVHVPGVEYDVEELRETITGMGGRVFFYEHFGSMSWSVIQEKIRYMVRALGVRDIFLDHLTALAASIDTDERKAIDKIMAELASLTQELDCTIYYISHLTTPEGKSHEEGGRVLEKHFRGSRSIGFWSHFLFGIERDKQDLEGVTTFRVLKDRYTGDSNGLTFGLAYSKLTGLLEECSLPETKTNPRFTAEDTDEY